MTSIDMAYTFYDASVAMAKSALKSLHQILSGAEKHPDSTRFINARLVDDMKPLSFQVHFASFQAQTVAATLSGRQYLEPNEDDVESYTKVHTAIDDAFSALARLDKESVNKAAEIMTPSPPGAKETEVPVTAMIGLVNMPNIYFHVTMAYAILRKEGVPLKKRSWSRSFLVDYI
jgi:hypothetical protein